MATPFWTTAKELLRYKRQLSIALFGALLSASCFGAGLGMLVPTLGLLLRTERGLAELIQQHLLAPERPQFIQDLGQQILPYIPQDPFIAFISVTGVIAVLTIIGSTGRYLHELITITVVQQAAVLWRDRIFRKLLQAPLAFALQYGQAGYLSRVIVDTAVLAQGQRQILGKSFAELLKGAAALTTALIIDWQLSLIALIPAPLIAVLLRKFGKRIRRASRRALTERSRLLAALKESLSALQVIKVHNAEGYERRRFRFRNRTLFGQEIRVRQARALSSPIIETLALLGVIGVAIAAAAYIFYQGVPAEQFIAVLVALGAAGATMKPLTNLHIEIKEAEAAAGRILEVMALPGEPITITERSRCPALPRHQRSVVFENVSYSYPGQNRPAVHNFSLNVPHGQTTAIVGPNGSGKTTILSLLPALLTPTAGRVLIDGIDVASVNLRSLREQIGVVTQQSILFSGTIADNIAYGRRHIVRERIIAAAHDAYADEFVATLPLGYDSLLGEDGTGLSGGQKQRLCIARAILRDPAILILDEATSQIDAESEAKITQALRKFRAGRTTFIIAHRLSTVIDADLIVVMDDGVIVDQGRHRELLERCDLYRTLNRTQLLAVGD